MNTASTVMDSQEVPKSVQPETDLVTKTPKISQTEVAGPPSNTESQTDKVNDPSMADWPTASSFQIEENTEDSLEPKSDIESIKEEKKPWVGTLPDDFLVIRRPQPFDTRAKYSLLVTIARATLVKNNGALPMSLYAVVTLGRGVTRTEQHNYCGTSPVWNTNVQFDTEGGIPRRLKVEIYDWGFVTDTAVAWGDVPLDTIYQHNGHLAGWYDLRGKEGHAGSILLEITLKSGLHRDLPMSPPASTEQLSGEQSAATMTPGDLSSANAVEDLKQLKDMFPQLDEEILQSVYLTNHCDLGQTIAQCLQMHST